MATHLRLGIAVLACTYVLTGCSSSPSPWSESSSPWGNKQGQSEEVATDDVADEEQNAFVEPVISADAAYTPIEPVGVAANMPVEAEPVMPDMMMDEPVIAEPPVKKSKKTAGGDIFSQPAGNFAVQVCASRTMKQLSTFAKRHNLSDQWTAQTTVRGETWYVLLEGVYATREEARSALAQISGQVDTRPWIRTIGSLQSVMR